MGYSRRPHFTMLKETSAFLKNQLPKLLFENTTEQWGAQLTLDTPVLNGSRLAMYKMCAAKLQPLIPPVHRRFSLPKRKLSSSNARSAAQGKRKRNDQEFSKRGGKLQRADKCSEHPCKESRVARPQLELSQGRATRSSRPQDTAVK